MSSPHTRYKGFDKISYGSRTIYHIKEYGMVKEDNLPKNIVWLALSITSCESRKCFFKNVLRLSSMVVIRGLSLSSPSANLACHLEKRRPGFPPLTFNFRRRSSHEPGKIK